MTQLGKVTGISYQVYSKEEIIKFIKESRDQLKKVQEQAVEHRKQHLHSLADKYAKENNLSQATVIQELISHESVRTTFEILRGKIKKKHKRSAG